MRGEITLKISGKRFNFFDNFSVTLKYDSIASVFSFEGVYDPKNEGQRQLFRPLSFNKAELFHNDQLFLTGEILNISTGLGGTSSLASLSGYSLPGILEDCPIPLDLYPLQFDNLTLIEIAEKIIKPFGLKLIVDPSVNSIASKKYEKTNSEPEKSIKEFLTDLATQRNIVLTHDVSGNLFLTRANVNNRSVATYEEGAPSTNITLSVDGQKIHSKITTMKQATIGTDVSGEETISNSLIKKYRPGVKTQNSGTNDDVISFARKERASELRAINLTIETDRWQWYDGKVLRLIQPNSIIDVISPSNFIDTRTRFFVEEVTFTGSKEIERATINCVLPACYTGEEPNNIFSI